MHIAPSSALMPGVARSMLDTSPDCIKLVDLDGTLLYMNANGQCAMEVDDFDVIAGAKWFDLWPDENRTTISQSVLDAAEGRSTRFEAFCPTAKGAPRWWDVSVAPVLDTNGRPERILSISRDITARVERERQIAEQESILRDLAISQARTLEEKEELLREKVLLMQEVDHRMKNSLSMITSLLAVQGRLVTDSSAREALSSASMRVHTIAAVHERLYKHGADGAVDLADYLRSLVEELDSTVGTDAIAITHAIDPLGDEPGSAAVTVGLIVNELVSNAARHAAPEGQGCAIVVEAVLDEDGRRELRVSDDGCGLPEGFDPDASRGIGMRVVTSSVARLGGTFEIERPDSGGVRFLVRF